MPAPTSSSKSALAERLNDHSVSTWSGRFRCVGTICFLGICMVIVPCMDCVIGHAHFLVLLPFFPSSIHPPANSQPRLFPLRRAVDQPGNGLAENTHRTPPHTPSQATPAL